MAKALVSVFNSGRERLSGLIYIDALKGVKAFVPLGTYPMNCVRGLASDEERIYALILLADQKTHCVAGLDSTSLMPAFVQEIPTVFGGHSMLASRGMLYIVSTANDRVIAYRTTDSGLTEPRMVWEGGSAVHGNRHHVNSIEEFNGRIVVSAFGPKPGPTWSRATNGYIYDIESKTFLAQGLRQPHSLTEHEGELFFCESNSCTLRTISGKAWNFDRYIRGLGLLSRAKAFIGFSGQRHALPGSHVSSCVSAAESGIFIYDLLRRTIEKVVVLEEFGHEVYDIRPWSGPPPLSLISRKQEDRVLKKRTEMRRIALKAAP